MPRVDAFIQPGKARYTLDIDHDDNCQNPFDSNDCMGRLVLFERGADNHNALVHDQHRNNPMALRIQKYDHGNVVYSLAGEGPSCPFDTSPFVGYWVCDGELLNALNTLHEKEKMNVPAWLKAAAASILDEYTKWCNGECYQWCITRHSINPTTIEIEREIVESSGGYIGLDNATEDAMAAFANLRKGLLMVTFDNLKKGVGANGT